MRHHARLGMGEETCGTWCKGDGGIRAGGISCTKSAPATGEKTHGTWCKGNGGTRAGGISCTKSASATDEKTRGTWCKGNGDIRTSGISCTKSPRRPRRLAPHPAGPAPLVTPRRRPFIRKFINFRMIIKVY